MINSSRIVLHLSLGYESEFFDWDFRPMYCQNGLSACYSHDSIVEIMWMLWISRQMLVKHRLPKIFWNHSLQNGYYLEHRYTDDPFSPIICAKLCFLWTSTICNSFKFLTSFVFRSNRSLHPCFFISRISIQFESKEKYNKNKKSKCIYRQQSVYGSRTSF